MVVTVGCAAEYGSVAAIYQLVCSWYSSHYYESVTVVESKSIFKGGYLGATEHIRAYLQPQEAANPDITQ
jgi:hypothetical protein